MFFFNLSNKNNMFYFYLLSMRGLLMLLTPLTLILTLNVNLFSVCSSANLHAGPDNLLRFSNCYVNHPARGILQGKHKVLFKPII